MKEGFTLTEIIIVIIIIGILATLGIIQYNYVIEGFRKREAKTYLSELRMAEIVYYRKVQTYGAIENLGLELPTSGPSCDSSQFYFFYNCDPADGRCWAGRCVSGGRIPPAQTTYTISLTIDGNFSP